jgi:hypothetical protein
MLGQFLVLSRFAAQRRHTRQAVQDQQAAQGQQAAPDHPSAPSAVSAEVAAPSQAEGGFETVANLEDAGEEETIEASEPLPVHGDDEDDYESSSSIVRPPCIRCFPTSLEHAYLCHSDNSDDSDNSVTVI